MIIGVLGALADYERELVKERTALKRQASRANGTKFGRPRKVDDPEHIATAKRMKADGGVPYRLALAARYLMLRTRPCALQRRHRMEGHYPIRCSHRRH